jgi:DNA-binding PadR family transcriptional regulator
VKGLESSDKLMSRPLTRAMFQVLLSLCSGERHGYGILQDIVEGTGSDAQVGTATLYRSIRQLVQAGLIAEIADRGANESEDERRRYYRLTERGQACAREEAAKLVKLVDVAAKRGLVSLPAVKQAGATM